MDAKQFDVIAKAMGSRTGRRQTLSSLLGGALGLLGLARAEDAWGLDKHYNRDCSKQCNQCEKCEKGKCRTKNGKKRCADGKCKPRANGVACAACTGSSCGNGTCQRGRCVASGPFCAGQNYCTATGAAPLCNKTGTAACVCALTTAGAPFCASAAEDSILVPQAPNSCSAPECAGRTCLNISACEGEDQFACALACPNPI